jgi:hypothetical protein
MRWNRNVLFGHGYRISLDSPETRGKAVKGQAFLTTFHW